MNTIDLSSGQSINDQVVGINGVTGNYGTLSDVTSTNPLFFWGAWSCCDAIPSCDSSITTIALTNSGGSYLASFSAFVGGRPARPIAK